MDEMYQGLEGLRERAEAGDAQACVELGEALLQRAPYESIPWESDSWMEDLKWGRRFSDLKAADCPGGGDEYWDRQVRTFLERMAEHKEELGRGTARRDEFLRAALRYFEKAAAVNDPEALWRLGWRHWLGQGTRIDKDRAFDWWKKAAGLGHLPSMEKLADHNIPVPIRGARISSCG
jgi:TPR repeat protein